MPSHMADKVERSSKVCGIWVCKDKKDLETVKNMSKIFKRI